MEMGKRKREDEKTKTLMQMEREYRETLAAYNKLQREHHQYTTYYQQEARKLQQTSSDCREMWFLEKHVKPNLFLLESERKTLQQRVQQQFQQMLDRAVSEEKKAQEEVLIKVEQRSTENSQGIQCRMRKQNSKAMGTNKALEPEIKLEEFTVEKATMIYF